MYQGFFGKAVLERVFLLQALVKCLKMHTFLRSLVFCTLTLADVNVIFKMGNVIG